MFKMFEKKEDTYKGYSESNPQPLTDDGYASKAAAEENKAAPFAPTQPNAYGQQGQPPYAPIQPNTYGRQGQPPYAPVQPNAYGQQGQPPYAPVPPHMYGQTAPMYTPGQPPRKKSVGKTIAIVIACIVGVNLLLFGGLVAYFMVQSPDKKIEAYQESGNLSDLIDACDIYDNQMPDVDDPVAAEMYFEIALSDTKAFLRAAKEAECIDYYGSDENDVYRTLMSDWLFLMLINGQYSKYNEIFVQKMLECSPSGTYYFDTYVMMRYLENDYITLTDQQKQVVFSAFDALLDACATEEERQLNLEEYYDFCEALGEYDKADAIEQQIGEMQTAAAA